MGLYHAVDHFSGAIFALGAESTESDDSFVSLCWDGESSNIRWYRGVCNRGYSAVLLKKEATDRQPEAL